jgi:hypothetical protein
MKSSLLLLAGACWFSLFLASSAVARPATVSDFSGKTICWDMGNKSTFHADGKLEDATGGVRTWRLGSAGLEMRTSTWTNGFGVQIQPNGTYVFQGTWVGSGQASYTAHICK